MTIAAGLGEPIATESAAWGDYDNDGRLDLFVCGEYAVAPATGLPASSSLSGADPRNRCRLYRNKGDGTFVDVAAQAGVRNERYAKGAAWGDYDDDGRLDLFVSNYGQANRLYRNEGDGTFVDVAPELGVTGPIASFSCWFWDYDNDGRLDLFVNDYAGESRRLGDRHAGPADATGLGHPRLYPQPRARAGSATSPPRSASTASPWPWGWNFGDIDNDGYLDLYLGTGRPDYSALVPNLMFKNVERPALRGRDRRRRAPATSRRGTASRSPTGTTTATSTSSSRSAARCPGDRAYNLLFRNPGHGRHWLKVKLVGTQTNRAALGARIRVDLDESRRHDALDLPHGRQQLQLRRQQPRRDDRPRRRHVGRVAHGHLADEPHDPDLPRPSPRSARRDHGGGRRASETETTVNLPAERRPDSRWKRSAWLGPCCLVASGLVTL